MSKLKFTQTSPLDQRVEIDGVDVSAHIIGLRIDAPVGETARAEVDLAVFEVEAEADYVYLAPRTAGLLKRLGWTPPEHDGDHIEWGQT